MENYTFCKSKDVSSLSDDLQTESMLENKLVLNTYTFRMNKGWFTCCDLFNRFALDAINKEKVTRNKKMSVMAVKAKR